MVAIAGRESNWSNLRNPNTSDTGMWQINWRTSDAARQLGVTERDQLLDPFLNARVAFQAQKNAIKYFDDRWHPWRASGHSQYLIDRGLGSKGWDPDGDPMWNTAKHMETARAVTAPYMGGDPNTDVPVRAGNVTNNMTSAPTFNVNPTINFQGAPDTPDLRAIVDELMQMTRQAMELEELRSM